MDKNNHSVSDDWENRVLCRDESCTGTIGSDGCCRVCGLPSGDGSVSSPRSTADEWDSAEEEIFEAEAEEITGDTPEAETPFDEDEPEMDSDLEERVLCPDESCTGTIGADGRCRVCGRVAE